MPISTELLRAILPIKGPTDAATGTEPRQAPLTLPMPGQQVQGEVLAKLSERVALLKIAGELYRADLPLSLKSGDILTLTFQGNEPRPTFTIRQGTVPETPVTISKSATLLNEVARQTQGSEPAAIRTGAPLALSSPTDTTALAATLRGALAHSGNFYESHLAQWFTGSRQFAEILKEPQNRLVRKGKNDQLLSGSSGPQNIHDDRVPATSIDLGNSTVEEASFLEKLLNLQNPEISSVVRDQAQTFMTGIFRWQGEVWPEQKLTWDIVEKENHTENQQEKTWQTTVRLVLPTMGDIDATLIITGTRVSCTVRTSSQTSCEQMERERTLLETGLSGAGLSLAEMVINCEGNK
jgi:hypothetical protein